MQNGKHKTRKLKAKQLSVFAFHFLLFTFCLLSVSGCAESPELQTAPRPDTASVNDLLPEAMQIIQQALVGQDPYIKVNAIEVVAVTKQLGLMPRVERLLRDDVVPVRFAAALAVGDVEYHLAERSVKQLLNDQDANVRIAAAYAMFKFGHPESFNLLSKAITSKDQVIRANAALLLGKSGNENALKPLYWTLRDKDSDDRVRFQAAESIAMLGDEEILPKLWAVVLSSYADDRVIGIRAMGALGTRKARDVLVTKLDDDILEVRLAAAEQLGMLSYTTGEPEVLDVFRKNLTAGLEPQARERVNVFTALAISQIGTPQLTKYLPQMLQDQSKLVRLAAAKAVLQCIMKDQSAYKQ